MSALNQCEPAPPVTAPLSPRFLGIDRLAERRLRGSSFLALRNVSCEYHEGVMTLRGRLPTYYLKQIAQELVAEVEGVEKVFNRIEVVSPVWCSPG
jgi:osmotically-inducible protein OsmY